VSQFSSSQTFRTFLQAQGAQYAHMDLDEFAEAMRERGWSEKSVEREVQSLKDYQDKFKANTPDVYVEEIAEQSLKNALPRRKRKSVQKVDVDNEE
jgi:biopolymer transport protein ExbB/TolQ